jgi:hypothetical protein
MTTTGILERRIFGQLPKSSTRMVVVIAARGGKGCLSYPRGYVPCVDEVAPRYTFVLELRE